MKADTKKKAADKKKTVAKKKATVAVGRKGTTGKVATNKITVPRTKSAAKVDKLDRSRVKSAPSVVNKAAKEGLISMRTRKKTREKFATALESSSSAKCNKTKGKPEKEKMNAKEKPKEKMNAREKENPKEKLTAKRKKEETKKKTVVVKAKPMGNKPKPTKVVATTDKDGDGDVLVVPKLTARALKKHEMRNDETVTIRPPNRLV
jgi:hypothetical protein